MTDIDLTLPEPDTIGELDRIRMAILLLADSNMVSAKLTTHLAGLQFDDAQNDVKSLQKNNELIQKYIMFDYKKKFENAD